MVDTIPESGLLRTIINDILRVVPSSSWAFALIDSVAQIARLLASDEHDLRLAHLRSEFESNRTDAVREPRIVAAQEMSGEFTSGVTLLFADHRRTTAILTIMRTTELGPFTSTELSMLTFAVVAGSEELSLTSAHAVARDEHSASLVGAPDEAFYVLDEDLTVILASNAQDQHHIAMTGFEPALAAHLPKLVEETVRKLIAPWYATPFSREPGVARPVPFLVVRTQPMSGPAGLHIGVRIEASPMTNSLTSAASRFHITPRELQVLGLLLDGTQLEEIGVRLHIASSTVQDHVRNMVEKTKSRNRTELVARVLGWEGSPGMAAVG
jgi:DNA-binding CsgD family transcriptional regulator